MEEMKYFYELFESLPRCGPGDNKLTRRAFNMIPKPPKQPLILDIGCGSGVQTIELAKISNGKIIALDNHQAFLDILMKRARNEGFEDNIISQNISMLDMDFDENTFDIVLSEGDLYFLGFQNGLKRCHQLLKNNGYLAVTEFVYLLPNPPAPVIQYCETEYPYIKNIQENIELIHKEKFNLIYNFTLSKSSWFDSFYLPMEIEISRLNTKYKDNQIALGILEGMKNEINMYKK